MPPTASAQPSSPATTPATRAANPTAARKRRPRKPKVTCEDCFFHRNMLCALDVAEPCPTFRHHEQGLKPPQQLSFVFRQERTRTAWAFEDRR
ncbi:MAG: hypothetical protein HZB14_10830 [Actinobacteria bacterium]|nr:hypothetical protein [Actinomycetota bacterium]